MNSNIRPWLMRSLAGLAIIASLGVVNIVSAENSTSTREHAKPVPKVLNVTCIQTAVDKRDNAIITANDTYHTATVTALQTRRDALKAAWAITTSPERRKALRSAWDTYRKSLRTARQTFNKSKNSVWKTYNTDRKTCNANGYDEGSASGNDSQL